MKLFALLLLASAALAQAPGLEIVRIEHGPAFYPPVVAPFAVVWRVSETKMLVVDLVNRRSFYVEFPAGGRLDVGYSEINGNIDCAWNSKAALEMPYDMTGTQRK